MRTSTMGTGAKRGSALRCAEVGPLLGVRDELDPPTASAVASHVDECPACAAALADEQLIVAKLRSIPIHEPPPGFESRLLALPTTSPFSWGPVLSERVVWLFVAVATALTAWSLWQTSTGQPGGLRPGSLLQVVDSGGAQDRGDGAGQRRAEDSGPSRSASPVDGSSAPGQPTVVARLRPIDLHRQGAVDAVSSAAGLGASGGTHARSAPPRSRPRSPAANRASAPSAESDEGRSPSTPTASNGSDQSPAPFADNKPAPTPVGAIPPVALPSVTPGSTCTGHMVAVRVRVVADVAGAGSAECPGCDGGFDELDLAMLAASGARMPVMQVAYYSRPQPDITGETTVLHGDARYLSPGELVIEFEPACIAADQWPLVAVVKFTSDDWADCAAVGTEIVLEGPDALRPTFYLHPVCPIAASPTAEPLFDPPADPPAVPPSPEVTASATSGAAGEPEPPPGGAFP